MPRLVSTFARSLVPTLTALVAVSAAEPETPAIASTQAGSATLRLLDISVNLMSAVGGSSIEDHDLGELQIGGHDPKRRGFTFQAAEIAISGAVDPYFTADLAISISEEHGFELEEAFVTTSSLPHGLEMKAGYYFTEFGRFNHSHPHSWGWLDRSLPAARLLGDEGMRGAGARVSWLAPTDTWLQFSFGIQNATGDYMPNFLGEGHDHGHDDDDDHGHGGFAGLESFDREVEGLAEFLYTLRAETALPIGDNGEIKLGLSAGLGPNMTGEDTWTAIYGVDAVYKWRNPSAPRGAGQLTTIFEFIGRTTDTESVSFEETDGLGSPTGDTLSAGGDNLHDFGVHAEVRYGFAPRWEVGLRAEYLWSRGDDWHIEEDEIAGEGFASEIERESTDENPDRATRLRLSPMISFAPSEFSKLRFQYNYDDAKFLDEKGHTFWLGLEVMIGAHPAHAF